MHEMSLAESVLEIIENSAAQHGCTKIHAVRLEIGQLAGVEAEAMRFCFDAVTRGSIAAGAALEIVETPGQGWCPACQAGVPVAARYEPCPLCGSFGVGITGGTEMRVKELEME
jgi:hydrogenase nickel incorporation protein HypA/HybF